MKRPAAAAPDFFSAQVSQARRFYLNLRPPRGAALAVVCGGVEQCAPDYEIRRDSFPYYSLEYVVRGEGRLQLARRRQALRPGDLFAYGPGVPQRITADPRKPLVKYFVDFAGAQAAAWLHRAGVAPGRSARVYPPLELQPLFDELIRNGQRGSRHAPELCRRLLDCLGVKLGEARAPRGGADSLAFATYQRCRQHLQDHCQRLRTLAQLARECHVNTAYLCRLFRRYDRQSPYRCLIRLKMNAAASQLQQPGALVKNVAADLGFANPYHFSRVFKSVFALAPEAFRQLR